MEASKLSCIGSPHHALCPAYRGIHRGGSHGIKAAQVVKPSTQMPPIGSGHSSSLSPQLSLLPVVGALSNLVWCLPVLAAEEASSSSAAEAGATQVSEIAGAALEGAGAAVSQAVQSSVEGAGAAASKTVQSSAEGVGDAASQVVQSAVGRVGAAASQTAGAAAGGSGDMVVNVLGASAFIALSLLTVAVVYLFLTDFLEKRKRDEEMKKLNEEEAATRKKKGGRLTAASKGGAKGFGRKRPVDDDVSAD